MPSAFSKKSAECSHNTVAKCSFQFLQRVILSSVFQHRVNHPAISNNEQHFVINFEFGEAQQYILGPIFTFKVSPAMVGSFINKGIHLQYIHVCRLIGRASK